MFMDWHINEAGRKKKKKKKTADSPALSFINPGYFFITHMDLIFLSLHTTDSLCRCMSLSIFRLAIRAWTCNNVVKGLRNSY